jgi:hypothetical protein
MSRKHVLLSFALLVPLAAQETTTPVAAIPAPGSEEASRLLEKACAKMLALGRGNFKTGESQDNALFRGRGLPFGNEEVDVDGGWNGGLVWGKGGEGDDYVRANGRMIAKTGQGWRLRGNKLPSGSPVPFTIDPGLLFAAIAEIPAGDRRVVHTEATQVAGKDVVVLSIHLEDDAATEFAECGAVPAVTGAGMIRIGGMGGHEPQASHEVDLALFVDATNGDVLRLRTKVYERNEMMANVQIQVAGGPGGDEEEEEEAEEAKAPAKAPGRGDGPVYKKGLPERKPAKTESVMYWKVDFTNLGMGEAPALDDKAKSLLGLR